MKITKFGHCCLLIEEDNLSILTDPGIYSTDQNDIKNIDLVLITHEHQDHLHIDSLKMVLANNSKARILTNHSVGNLLDKEGIEYEILEDGQNLKDKGISIEAFGKKHAVIHPAIPQTENTGYFIANKFFYPGDAFTDPHKPVEILACPVAGPWLRLSDGIEYAKELKPKICFPVHDGILKSIGSTNRIPSQVLPPFGIEFIVPEINKAISLL